MAVRFDGVVEYGTDYCSRNHIIGERDCNGRVQTRSVGASPLPSVLYYKTQLADRGKYLNGIKPIAGLFCTRRKFVCDIFHRDPGCMKRRIVTKIESRNTNVPFADFAGGMTGSDEL